MKWLIFLLFSVPLCASQQFLASCNDTACPKFGTLVIGKAKKITVSGSRTVPEGILVERSIYLKCPAGHLFCSPNEVVVPRTFAVEMPPIPCKPIANRVQSPKGQTL
jgi:hypothetical protein